MIRSRSMCWSMTAVTLTWLPIPSDRTCWTRDIGTRRPRLFIAGSRHCRPARVWWSASGSPPRRRTAQQRHSGCATSVRRLEHRPAPDHDRYRQTFTGGTAMQIGFIGLGMMGAGMASEPAKGRPSARGARPDPPGGVPSLEPAPPGPKPARGSRGGAIWCSPRCRRRPMCEKVGTGRERPAVRLPQGRRLVRSVHQRGGAWCGSCTRNWRNRAWSSSMRRSAAVRAAPTAAGWRSGSAATRRCSTSTSRCSTRWATRRAISARSAPARSPSWCTMPPAPR